jgi:putative FmdB family regulatory protein
MPIFEYVCNDCKKRFEALVYGSQEAQCPLCRGGNLDQQISVFSVGPSRSVRPAPPTSPCGTGACGQSGCCPYE